MKALFIIQCAFLILSGVSCRSKNNFDRQEVIGFKVIDSFRPGPNYYADSINHPGRPVFIRLWYPAIANGIPMSYGTYINSFSAENRPGIDLTLADIDPAAEVYSRLIQSFSDLDSASVSQSVVALSKQSTDVYLDVQPTTDVTPLILVAGANPVYHIDLIEYLAKQGFVVASISRLAPREESRIPFDQQGSKLMTDDLDFAIEELTKLPFVDKNNVSFLAWSFEGLPALVAAQENSGVNCVVSLDASVGYAYSNHMMEDSTKFVTTPFSFPLIHFTGPGLTHGKSFDLLRQLSTHSDVWVIEVPEMTHASFTSIASVIIPAHFSHQQSNPNYRMLLDAIAKITQSTRKESFLKLLLREEKIFSKIDLQHN